MKLRIKITNGQMELDRQSLSTHLATMKDGPYDLIIRPEIKWDVDKMRKYFHGPVINFVKSMFHEIGHGYSKNQVKEYMKSEHGKTDKMGLPASTSTYTFEDYKKFLNDINVWCIECFKIGIPPSEGEE